MNPKLIEAQIEAQALAEAWRSAIVEYQGQKVKADAQVATAEEVKKHVNSLRHQVKEAHEKLEKLVEQEHTMRALATGGRLA